MARYYNIHLQHLYTELQERYDRLTAALPATNNRSYFGTLVPDGVKVRVAVDDFKAILTEIRRLK